MGMSHHTLLTVLEIRPTFYQRSHSLGPRLTTLYKKDQASKGSQGSPGTQTVNEYCAPHTVTPDPSVGAHGKAHGPDGIPGYTAFQGHV